MGCCISDGCCEEHNLSASGSLRIPQVYALILFYLPVNVLLILGTYQLYRKRVV